MEKDLMNDVQKMISSTTDQKDDAAMNEGGTVSDSSTTDQKGDDVAMNPGGAKMEESHQKEGGDDGVALSDSSKKRKFEWILAMGPSETETTSAETSSKKRCGSAPTGNVHTMKLKAGQDVVEALYELSKEYDHLRFVTVIAVIGSVSEVVLLDPNRPPNTLKGVFEIISLSVSCSADEDGRHCREKATCSVSLTDDKGETIQSTSVGSLIAAGPLRITAATSTVATPPLKSVQVEKVIEELKSSLDADGNVDPTITTSAENDQDIKSPSEEDIWSPIRE